MSFEPNEGVTKVSPEVFFPGYRFGEPWEGWMQDPRSGPLSQAVWPQARYLSFLSFLLTWDWVRHIPLQFHHFLTYLHVPPTLPDTCVLLLLWIYPRKLSRLDHAGLVRNSFILSPATHLTGKLPRVCTPIASWTKFLVKHLTRIMFHHLFQTLPKQSSRASCSSPYPQYLVQSQAHKRCSGTTSCWNVWLKTPNPFYYLSFQEVSFHRINHLMLYNKIPQNLLA